MSPPSLPQSLSELPPEVVAFDAGPRLIKATVSMTAIAVLIVIIRFSVRLRASSGHRLGVDDWLIMLAAILLCIFTTTGVLGVYKGGMGRYLVVNMIIDPMRLQNTLLYLYISEYFYFTVLLAVKASILTMYIRIFPTRFMKTAAYVLGGFVGVLWLASILVVVFQCTPVQKAYLPYLQEGYCLDTVDWFLGNSVPNVLSELLILILPTREIWKLQVSRPQKVAISVVFLMGTLVVIVTCIRLEGLVAHGNVEKPDLTKDIAHGWIYTCAEPVVAIIAACLPAMSPLLRFIFGKAFSSRHSKNSDEESPKRHIVTIGGSGKSRELDSRSEGLGYSRYSSTQSLDSLGDGNGKSGRPDTPVPWPETPLGNQVTIYGKPSPSFAEIPTVSMITVRRDFRLTAENAPSDDAASEPSVAEIGGRI